MASFIWPAIGLLVVGFLAGRAGRIWSDATQRGLAPAQRLGWALRGVVRPARYWWAGRLAAMSPEEQADLLAREVAALGLSRADGQRCPLCRAEVPHAWTLTGDGQPTVAPGPVQCPACDFRLDADRRRTADGRARPRAMPGL